MGSDRKRRERQRKQTRNTDIEFSTFGIPIGQHEEFKAAMLAAARSSVAQFPDMLNTLREQLRSHDPLGIVASFAAYGLRAYVSNSGVVEQKGVPILQHHAELLQAIMLSIPRDQWGEAPVVPDIMQRIFDTVPKLSEAFHYKNILQVSELSDKSQLLMQSLQKRISMHTHGVRNWGYYGEVVGISKQLFGSLDAAFQKHYGFSASGLVEIMRAIVKEFERRQTEHFSILKKVFTGKNVRQIARHYYKYVPDLKGSPEDLIHAMPGIDRDGIKIAIISHFDLRLAERAIFNAKDLAELTGLTEHEVQVALQAISLRPGDLETARAEHLFLDNPVWQCPIVDLDGSFFIPIPQMAFSHIHRIMDRLCAEAGLKEQLSQARSRMLENKVEETFRRALPGAEIRSSVKWTLGDQQFETDLLVVIDRTVVIAEAKSNRLTAEGLRGAPDRVRRHVADLVLFPSQQSERLSMLIEGARNGDPIALKVMEQTKLDATQIDNVVRLSVTLDDMSILTSAESDFKALGWVPGDHELAPTILISDLGCIADVLADPLQFLHYLSERSFFQKNFNLLGDELDFLGLYLATGFNLSALQRDDMQLVPSGMSEPLDRYYNGRDAGIHVPKPKMKLSPSFSRILRHLVEKRPPGWTTIGMHLLGCAGPSEQATIERQLDGLRRTVQKTHHQGQLNSLHIQPPDNRKARIIFFAFPAVKRTSMRIDMEQLASEALEDENVDDCIVFGRNTDQWDKPYDSVIFVQSGHGRTNANGEATRSQCSLT